MSKTPKIYCKLFCFFIYSFPFYWIKKKKIYTSSHVENYTIKISILLFSVVRAQTVLRRSL